MHRRLDEIIKDWPKEPREAAKRVIAHYGAPDEYSESRIIWNHTKDGWKPHSAV